jgi:adenylosuccinate lyase
MCLKFMIGTVDAGFLFGDDVVQYLEKFREKVARLQNTQSRLEFTKDQNKRGNLANFKKKQFTELSEEYEKMKAVFKPYLNVSERLKG